MRKQTFVPIRLLLVAVLLAVVAPSALAQTAALRGFVTDDDDGQALPGVNVVVEDGSGELRGTATDVNGFYYLPALPPGRHVLRATYLGYDPYVDSLALEPDEVRQLDIRLTTGQTELDAVTVESERTSGAANVTAGLQSIRAQDIELVPTPDVSGDLASYLSTVPGIVAPATAAASSSSAAVSRARTRCSSTGLRSTSRSTCSASTPPSPPTSSTAPTSTPAATTPGSVASSRPCSTWRRAAATSGGSTPPSPSRPSSAPRTSRGARSCRDRVSFLGSGRVSVIEQGASKLIDQPLPYDFGDVFGKLHAGTWPRAGSSP